MAQVGQWLRRLVQRVKNIAEEQQPAAETPEALLRRMLGQMTEALRAVLSGVVEELIDQVAAQLAECLRRDSAHAHRRRHLRPSL